MEGQQGGDLDPGTGRHAGGGKRRNFFIFYLPFNRQNSSCMLEWAKGDAAVKTDGRERITVEVALL